MQYGIQCFFGFQKRLQLNLHPDVYFLLLKILSIITGHVILLQSAICEKKKIPKRGPRSLVTWLI